jgi:hypothetical protein
MEGVPSDPIALTSSFCWSGDLSVCLCVPFLGSGNYCQQGFFLAFSSISRTISIFVFEYLTLKDTNFESLVIIPGDFV